jgi:peptide/nickel transport system substrate-binding protein
VADTQTFANYSRFTAAGPKPWALTLALNKVKPANVAKQKQIQSKIQKYILEQLPAIPLWYNGLWSQYNTTYWTNFPKSAGAGLQTTPSVWNGYLNMTGIDALARLKPAKQG